MIEWWWLLGGWAVVVTAAAIWSRELRAEVLPAVLAVVCSPLILLTWVITRLDVGAVPLDARSVAEFAQMRSADHRPAWMFFAWKRGILILRQWEVGDERPKVQLRLDEVFPDKKDDR